MTVRLWCGGPVPLAGDHARYHSGCASRSKGRRYPADAPTTDEIVPVMRHADPRSRL